MRQVKLCASGLPTAARLAAAQLGEALGARYSDCMRASTTHLLVPMQSGEKFERAAEFGVVSFAALFFRGSRERERGRDESFEEGKKNLAHFFFFHVLVFEKKTETESRHPRMARRLRLRGPQGRGS